MARATTTTKTMVIFTAVTPAPAPAMNLSEFLMSLFVGINAPTYYKQSKCITINIKN